MSYPDYPNNRLVVNGTDLTTTYDLILADGYTLEPPSIKTYTVDIPGGNGVLDLTESLLGDTAYGNRKQEFIFYALGTTNFEQKKTQLSNLLHGRAYNYTMTMDPEYTYHGRFTVSSYSHSSSSMGIVGAIKVSIDSDPFKYKAQRNLLVNAVGGKVCYFDSGRKRVRPTIEVAEFVKLIYDGKLVMLPVGSWTINDLFFTNGLNEIYLNSYPIHNLTWGDLRTNGTTWGELGTQRLFEWYKSNGDDNIVYDTWAEVSANSWDNYEVSTWSDLTHIVSVPGNIENAHVKYDWGDL